MAILAGVTPSESDIVKSYDIGCQLVILTNRKSHGFSILVPTSVTLSDLERRGSPYFALFHGIR